MPIPARHEFEFEVLCNEKSIEFFQFARQKQDYPSRYELLSTTLYNSLRLPFDLVSKVLYLAVDVFAIMLISFDDKDYKLLLQARFIRLLVINPLEIVTTLIAETLRISISALGILLPSCTLFFWEKIERLELYAQQFKLFLLKDLVPVEKARYVISKIHPSSAMLYLGHQKVHALREAKISNKDDLEREIQTHCKALFDLLSKSYQEFFDKLKRANSSEKKEDKKFFCKEYSLEAHAQMIKQIEKFLPADACFFNLPAKELETMCQYLFFSLEYQLIQKTETADTELKSKMNDLHDQFSLRFGFGRVKHPSFSRECYHFL